MFPPAKFFTKPPGKRRGIFFHHSRQSISTRSIAILSFAFPGWVNVVATTVAGELVLIRQYRFGTDRLELEIPGGAINDGEDPLAAGLRKLLAMKANDYC